MFIGKRIICLVADGTLSTDQWKLALLLPQNYELRHFTSLTDLISYSFQTTELVSGFICELRLLLKASLEEKVFFTDMLDYFAIFRMKTEPDPKPTGGLVVTNSAEELKQFFLKVESLPPRGIRKFKRSFVQLNVLICAGSKWDSNRAFSATTRDLSRGGCFAVDTTVKVPTDEIMLKFSEIGDVPAIKCKIARYIPWGKNYRGYSGWGIKFIFPPGTTHTVQDWVNRLLGG